ncbi:hypothetical protein BJ944DRAFT_276143 [Cunninghamella echinulata]|nr:hypothetical protein BJ944DRAFT_276143 [Cunninghamella echinulata]
MIQSTEEKIGAKFKDGKNPPRAKLLKVKENKKNIVKLCPSHSLILDVSDNYWKDVFTPEEMVGISSDQHGKSPVKDLLYNVQNLLDDIKYMVGNITEDLRLVKSTDIKIEQEMNLLWVYKAITNSACSFISSSSHYLFTERNVLYIFYGFLLDFYDGSDIEAISDNGDDAMGLIINGGLSSSSSTYNSTDTIYTSGLDDLGYCEAARYDNQTKKFKGA